MIISDADIHLASSRICVEQHEKKEHLTVWRDDRQTGASTGRVPKGEVQALAESLAKNSVQLTISTAAKHAQPVKAQVALDEKVELEFMGSAKLNILRLLVERMSGRKIKIITPSDLHREEYAVGEDKIQEAGAPVQQKSNQ